MSEIITVLTHCYLQRTDRYCPINVTFPDGLIEPAPVILHFHGKGGTRDHYPEIAEDWAKCGYITLRPDMRESPNVLGHEADNDWKERYRDGQDIAELIPSILNPLDLAIGQLGLSGHSFGGRNVLAAFGLRTTAREENFLIKEAISGLVLSPAVEDATLVEEPYRSIEKPTFHATGTEDGKDLGDPGPSDEDVDYTARCKAYEGVVGPAILSVFKNGDHGHGFPFGALGRTFQPQIDMDFAQYRSWWEWTFSRDLEAEEVLTIGDWPNSGKYLTRYETRNWPPSHG